MPDEAYTAAMVKELEARVQGFHLEGREVNAIYVGGGTPSLWQPQLFAQVLKAVHQRFTVAPGCEVTLEANPGAADASRFSAYREAGVNRLSMGVQSFDAATLARLGRAHDGPMAVAAFHAARAAGFTNLSLDFIYGVQGQSIEDVQRDASAAVALGPEHLSAYALTLDRESLAEDVPLAKQLARKEVCLPEDEEVTQMQRVVERTFNDAGLLRYEVSNYARPGFHSRHNAAYWTQGEYLALGVGAVGYVHEARFSNHRSVERYLEAVNSGRLPEASREPLSNQERFTERLAMGLRLTTGLDLEAVCTQFGAEVAPRFVVAQQLVQGGLATWVGRRLALTQRGFDLHSEVCARLM